MKINHKETTIKIDDSVTTLVNLLLQIATKEGGQEIAKELQEDIEDTIKKLSGFIERSDESNNLLQKSQVVPTPSINMDYSKFVHGVTYETDSTPSPALPPVTPVEQNLKEVTKEDIDAALLKKQMNQSAISTEKKTNKK